MLTSFSEAIAHNIVTNLTDNGKCTGCGLCCSNYLPLSDREIKDIKRYIEKHPVKEDVQIPLSYMVFNLTCPFLDNTKERDKCKIYPVRPEICRKFICSQTSKEIGRNKVLFHLRKRIVDMREEFFC